MHILMIARHYPPEISGGARRPYLYAKELRRLGHRITIITPFKSDDPDHIAIANKSIEKGVAARVSATAIKPKSRIRGLKTNIRQWMLWPDPEIDWANTVARDSQISGLSPDILFSTSPPESAHIAGAKLANKLGIPWVAELRDTWIEAPHRSILETSWLRRTIERKIAKSTLATASAITTVSQAVLTEGKKYVKKGTPELIVPHFSNKPQGQYVYDSSRLNVLHSGGFTLSDRRRHIEPLLGAIDDVAKIRPEISLHVAGPVTIDEQQAADQYRFPVIFHGHIPLDKSRAMQAGADGLILYTPEDSHALPGKFAEYHLTGRPILYLGSGGWLDLVPDPSYLRPLKIGLSGLKKQELLPVNKAFTSEHAAEELANFLQKLL